MTAVHITSKGRITIPAAMRDALRIGAGDRIEFVEIGPGRYELIAVMQPVTALKGMFGESRRSVSIEQMNRAIAARGASAR